jgi:hypothetical protein
MSSDRVMLLIDADNVSADVIEQAVALLLAEHGALHVRRAYCTAESAVQNQALFKRLQIKPMVNLAAGKNSTDIALAVDAVDLVLAERPELVVIASSDSDFAPLVGRLREKGCRVEGIGQQGKTGDETQAVYDGFTVLTHKPRAAARTAAPARAARAPAKKAAPRKAAAAPAPTEAAVPTAPSVRAVPSAPRAPRAPRTPEALDRVQQILQALPELARGEAVELQVAGERLRKAKLLSRSGSSKKLLGQHADRFELLPAGQPTRVVLR